MTILSIAVLMLAVTALVQSKRIHLSNLENKILRLQLSIPSRESWLTDNNINKELIERLKANSLSGYYSNIESDKRLLNKLQDELKLAETSMLDRVMKHFKKEQV